MTYKGARILAEHLMRLGFQVVIALVGDGAYCLDVLDSTGHRLESIYTEEDFQMFVAEHNHQPTHIRFLLCPVCSHAFSAHPEYYGGKQGIFTHCGRALQLWRATSTTFNGYMIAESVDLEYLQRPHNDGYGDFAPIEMNDGPLLPRQLRLQPIEPNQPVDPTFSLEQWGYILYSAGYTRDDDGVWKVTGESVYTPMQEGDTIERLSQPGYSFALTLAEQWNAATKGPLFTFWTARVDAA